ncbi:MAG: DNA repair protein RadC [Clostridiales bacterium]|nr:DNA repair protein RadC [Clostridiales bacterium]
MDTKYNVTISELPECERPREKMYKMGPKALSNAELLAIILRTGIKNQSALALAYRILSKHNGLKFLVNTTVEELSQIDGIGLAKATQLMAAAELGRRISQYKADDDIYIRCPKDAAELLMEDMRYLNKEHMKVILLNIKCKVISIEEISVGSLSSSLAHPREIFIPAIKKSSAAIIMAHNHPSGDPHPSKDDVDLTKRIYEAGKILGIELYDHIIIGNGDFVSLKEKNLF